MITRNFKLFLTAGRSIPLLINANQYDHGETWVFTLYDETGQKYTPSSGAIVGIKSDGYVIADTGTVNSAGQVVIIESEQMTAAAGKAIYELEIDGQTHGTANFCLMVEPKPGDGGIVSDSDLSLIQQALDSTNPEAIAQGVSDWMDENLTPTTPVVDASLTVQGAAADAKKVGDEISDVKSQIGFKNLEATLKTGLYVDDGGFVGTKTNSQIALIDLSELTLETAIHVIISGTQNRCRLLFTETDISEVVSGTTGTYKDKGTTTTEFDVTYEEYHDYATLIICTNYQQTPYANIKAYINQAIDYLNGEVETLTASVEDLTSRISSIVDEKTIEHSENVTLGTTHIFNFSDPIPSNTKMVIDNTAASGEFSINLIKSDGTWQNVGEISSSAPPLTVTVDFPVYGIRSYVNGTAWSFTISYGGYIENVEERVDALETSTGSAANFPDSAGIQGVKKSVFKFLASTYYSGYTNTTNGVTYTILDDHKISLSGTATANFNIDLAYKSFEVAPKMYYYVKTDDSSFTTDKGYLHAGCFKEGGTAYGGTPISIVNGFAEQTLPSDADTSRCYLHIESGSVFNSTILEFYAFTEKPLLLDEYLTAKDIFNGEPYTGTYDWQTPVVNYGKLFKGKSKVEAFAFFTDPHVLGFADDDRNETKLANYLKRVQKVYNATPCSFIVSGGDWLNNATTMDEACYRLGYLKGIADHLLDGCKLVVGNHDTNYQGKQDASSEMHTGRLTDATIASIMFRDTDTKKAYYSFEGSNSKCYVLDSGIEHGTMLDYDWEQVAWLGSKLKSDDAEHSIIFLHIIVESGSIQANANNFASLVQAYNNHTTVVLNGITYNFTSCTGHVDFWVGGHTHADSNGTLGGIPYFITATNSFNSDVPLIDLVLADYDAGTINLIRVGGTGSDRVINMQ